jgi:hypothetical protein
VIVPAIITASALGVTAGPAVVTAVTAAQPAAATQVPHTYFHGAGVLRLYYRG